MLLGEHDHTLDDKNRLTLPAKLRPAFEDGVWLTRGLDGNIDVYPREEWERLRRRIDERNPLEADGRRMRRSFGSGAAQTALDRQGRLVIPPALIADAKLGREVTVIGVLDYLEIWDRAAWRAEKRRNQGGGDNAAERLAE